MKKNILKVCALIMVPALAIGLTSCKKSAGSNSGYTLQDTEVYPAVSAPYEQESRAVIQEYYEVANNYKILTGEIDQDNAKVQAAAIKAAAELYAYACYNEEYVDKYVYFSDQKGKTNYGGFGESEASKQDYKLIIHGDENTTGYKYHYTIKYVDSASGVLSALKSQFESAMLRFVEDTDSTDGSSVLYRFSGEDVHYDDEDYLTCDWVKGKEWGVSDNPIIKRSGDKLTLDEIVQDIKELALSSDPGNAVIHGNINILAENIISSAYIWENTNDDGDISYMVAMNINTDVANKDEYSLSMLRNANSSSNCVWNDDSFGIVFEIWDNGLFKWYLLYEDWTGDVSIAKNGSATSSVMVEYSYSDRDTDITDKLAMLNRVR